MNKIKRFFLPRLLIKDIVLKLLFLRISRLGFMNVDLWKNVSSTRTCTLVAYEDYAGQAKLSTATAAEKGKKYTGSIVALQFSRGILGDCEKALMTVCQVISWLSMLSTAVKYTETELFFFFF